ncbi:hypothetical protein VP1G_02640 [Cytospora mali]|uniref:Uncharacterized protein n=1 Tax=Cytospora mali TaxID=578113 RepID=A0A194UUF3_CYTMA|nr:hypothetical protein VP1G_02640 [Valsa mali var. pyri (nom. inval.)]
MSPKSTKFNLPSLVKDTRTRTSRNNNKKGGGAILPGGYTNYSASSMAPSLWSPYARPPRRSKKLVLLWVGTFLFIGFVTWYLSSRHRMANSYAEVLTDAPPKEAAVEEYRGFEFQRKHTSSSAAGDYDKEYHRQSLSRAIQSILKSEEVDRKAKVPTALPLEHWIPQSSYPGYPSSSMKALCIEFAQLATELQDGRTG